jgi:hypothetical protein
MGLGPQIDAYTSPPETLDATSSQLNSEALAVREVLAHPHMVFHPYTCRFHGGAATVAVVLIDYDDLGLLS